ncbi:MAG TPA: PAS domain S-box protein [Ideonella sp.]|uniref:PAS domain S-box protein n=1 Tax=Ideonella sp. TaxID=1929293 RepID=UPI002E301529|nr:PAS domain S-box protein [Ideonella sp.]HEX5687507.1 PAS domain S-box protein [Ideonella sp.]
MNAPTTRAALPAGIDDTTVFRSLFAAYPDALLVADAGGQIVLANPAAATLLGYTIEELVGSGIDMLVPDSIRPRHAAYREAYGRAPRTRPMGTQMELVARRRDGSEVMVEIALSPLQNHGLPLVVAAIRDIGAYPRVRQALQRARYSEHLAQLGRLAVDARDPQAVLEHVPAIAAEALQVEMATVFLLEPNRLDFRVVGGVGLVPGKSIGARVPNRPDTPPGFVYAEGRPVIVTDYRTERRFQVPQAYLDAALTSGMGVPLSDRGRITGVLAVHSISAQRFGDDEVRFLESLANLLATSQQRAQSEEALNHAQRLESVGQLTGGIAHDFNNLLTVIQGNLQVLEELPALADDAYGQQLVAAATRASRRGAELTSKLLAFSRRQVLQPSTVDVSHLLLSLADMLRRTLDQRIRIEVDAPADCPPVLADPGQLESALLNIAINARDAMPEGGTLRFTAAAGVQLPAALSSELDHPATPDSQFVAISIADSGAGMSDEVKERAFEPFFTTKEVGRGTGLGLSTVYGFVKQSKGAIEIQTAPGKGTTLTLYIPQPQTAASHENGDPAAGEAVPPGLKVLLVEDDAEVRAVVHTFLDTLGCVVTACTNAEHALETLTPDTDFDLLLTDIALGAGMRGTALAQQAQHRFPRLAILLMSGFSAELLDADREAPASWELLPKPYTRDQLARAIARVIAPA